MGSWGPIYFGGSSNFSKFSQPKQKNFPGLSKFERNSVSDPKFFADLVINLVI